jgi:hypothetical protein
MTENPELHPVRREGGHLIGFITNARDSDGCYTIYDAKRKLLGWAKEYDCAQVYLHEFADGKAPRLVPLGYSDIRGRLKDVFG